MLSQVVLEKLLQLWAVQRGFENKHMRSLFSFRHFNASGIGGKMFGCGLSAMVFSLALSALFTPARASEKTASATSEEFASLVKMAPFVVKGQPLAISIYARSKGDRRYGEQFSEGVFQVVFQTITESTGKGLVIVGAKGEPHPIFVFRKFLTLAKDGRLDPQVAAHGPELSKMMERWRHALSDEGKGGEKKDEPVDLEYDRIVAALPLPLEGIGTKLYQLAWEERFDEARVEARLCALREADLGRPDMFKRFDWAFYLPPKGAFDRVLNELISDALKKEDVGFFARMAVKTVLLAVKPKIRRIIEGVRQGLLLMTIVQARTQYGEQEVSDLTGAYIEAFLPSDKKDELSDQERCLKAVRECRAKLEEKARAGKEDSEEKTSAAEQPASARN